MKAQAQVYLAIGLAVASVLSINNSLDIAAGLAVAAIAVALFAFRK